jgi:organic hydroperoxide reductase OsmC/OhrA
LYTTKIHSTGGREGGASRSDDGRLDVTSSSPGAARGGTNPEQLFAVGWSACFISSIQIAVHKMASKSRSGRRNGLSVEQRDVDDPAPLPISNSAKRHV